MFDKHIICDEGFENIVTDGNITGFSLLARLPYYRGLGLSMIEDIAVTVNGELMPRKTIRLSLRGKSWTLDEMETVYDARWNFGEKAKVIVSRAGGLPPGIHRIGLAERLRISYLPFTPTTSTVKEMTLVG